jgi:HK97 family phage major capsid protein
MTTQERISALENSRAAHVARMQVLSEKAAEEGRPFDETEQQEFDGLDADVKAVDAQLVRDRRMAELAIAKAARIEPETGKGDPAPQRGTPILFQRANLEKGIPFARYVKAMAMSRGNVFQAHAIAENHKGWRDTSPQVAQFLKAAVAAGTTTASAWADDLVYAQNLVSDFVDLLRPATIVGRIPGLRRVPFNIRVGTKTSGGTAYWVGEGKPIPLSRLQTNVLTLGRTKIAGMMSITRELAMDSSPSAEMLVRDDLRDVIVELMDQSFIDPTRDASANVSPASVTYGVTPVTRSGSNAAALRTDVATLFGNFITADIPLAGGVWIMTQTTAVAISMMQNALGQPEFATMTPNGGTFLGYPAIVSQTALMTDSPSGGNLLIFLIPSEVMLADDGGVDIEVSGEASIQMSDTPNNDATTGTGQSLVSMFQTDSVAIRAIRHVNWGKRRTGAVQFIDDVIYAA